MKRVEARKRQPKSPRRVKALSQIKAVLGLCKREAAQMKTNMISKARKLGTSLSVYASFFWSAIQKIGTKKIKKSSVVR